MSVRPNLAIARRERDLSPNPAQPVAVAAVPVPVARETHVYSACKMPLSMFQAVQHIARTRRISNSEVIRYFVGQGLHSTFALGAGVQSSGENAGG